MSVLEVMGVLLAVAAGLAFINLKLLRLPTTIGLMLLALLHAVALLVVGHFYPSVLEPAKALVGSIDFNETLMHGMLGYLLFAGALHVNLNDLRQKTWIIMTLATVGVVTTTALVGFAIYFMTGLLGLELELLYCFIFGSLIAPTDPIAVLAILKKVGAPKGIETKLAGESLFNDGVGVVVFIALMQVAGMGGHGGEEHHYGSDDQHEAVAQHGDVEHASGEGGATDEIDSSGDLGKGSGASAASALGLNETEKSVDVDWGEVGMLFAKDAGGGLLFGLVIGLVAYLMLRWCNDYKTEILITLALVAGGYALAIAMHISGPLAMVVAGLLIGNRGRALAMSDETREHLDTFWELIDEMLNAVLFVLIGLEVLVLSLNAQYLVAGALAVPLVLLARFISVGGAVGILRNVASRAFSPHVVKVMTWAGLRGGISVALALSLKDSADGAHADEANLILTMTYVVVACSIIGQGLTVSPLLRVCGLAGKGEPDAGH